MGRPLNTRHDYFCKIAITLTTQQEAAQGTLRATVYDLNNQPTASCCNFPSMHASRQRGPIP